MRFSVFIKTVLCLLFLLPAAEAQVRKNEKSVPTLNKITMRVADVKTMSDWYKSVFKFKKKKSEENKAILKKDDFVLELVQEKSVVTSSKLVLPDGLGYLSRFNKFGFIVGNLDELFTEIERRKLETVGGVFPDERLKFRTFIVKDPEGNLVQFFEPRGFLENFKPRKNEWKPVFLMILTDNAQRTIAWYGKNLGFKEIVNVDNPSRKIIHRTLFNGSVLLELAEITGKVAAKEKYAEIWKNVGGITATGFSNNKTREKFFDDSSNLIELDVK